jgi:hypothetical protein
MAMLLAEHLLFMALMIAYLVLIINENEVCSRDNLVRACKLLTPYF